VIIALSSHIYIRCIDPSKLMQQEHFEFVYCIEQLVFEHRYTDWESCFQTTGMDSQAILDCYNSGYGQKV